MKRILFICLFILLIINPCFGQSLIDSGMIGGSPVNWATPGPIGTTTPAAGNFTTINSLTFIKLTTGFTMGGGNTPSFLTLIGGYNAVFNTTAATNLTLPTSGLVTALGNTTSGSGNIPLTDSPVFTTTIYTPALSAGANATPFTLNSPLVFGSLGTATRGIDLSGSGLSGATDYWIYNSSSNYWTNTNLLVAGNITLSSNLVSIGGGLLFTKDGDYPQVIAELGQTNKVFRLGLFDKSDALLLAGTYNTGTFVGSLTDCSSNGTTTITKATHGLTLAAGELVHVTASSTAGDKGFYRYVSGDANTIVVDRALGTSTGIAFTVYKDVISMHATDGTNGQMLTSWSAQNKPMQLGGTVLAATTGLTSADLYIGGNIGFSGETANGTVATVLTSLGPAGAQTTVQGWITIIDSGGTARYIPYF